MAEERNVGLARAPEPQSDDDATKAELQRRMEEARENITQTVTEIKETVATQYQQVRETISDSLDWREQYRRRPLPFTIGAMGVGLILGYNVGGVFKGGDDDEDYDDDAFDRIESGFEESVPRAYAAQAITGAPSGSSNAYLRALPNEGDSPVLNATPGTGSSGDVGPDTRPSYSSGYAAPSAPSAAGEIETAGVPGIFDRFKETKAYDRLQAEISTLGNRAVEELSKTAQTVILPAILGKLKDLIGIDLSTQREVAERSKVEHEAVKAAAAASAADEQQTSGQGAGVR
ncbi:MAG TPA: hypothetical protein VM934_16725 [Pyrinomonadaceae bacterium]|jgi:ElaB/YqjD/DUF883 family membrane-anchored ribosome-binding protein|nr:hypothetical protein [Pyrinomonadaceae bacterium]